MFIYLIAKRLPLSVAHFLLLTSLFQLSPKPHLSAPVKLRIVQLAEVLLPPIE